VPEVRAADLVLEGCDLLDEHLDYSKSPVNVQASAMKSPLPSIFATIVLLALLAETAVIVTSSGAIEQEYEAFALDANDVGKW